MLERINCNFDKFAYHLNLSYILLPPNIVLVLWPHGRHEIVRVHYDMYIAIKVPCEYSMPTCNKINYIIRPRGKENTEVRITQNKGKESENSYQKLKRSRWTGT